MRHELKIWPDFFKEVASGNKRFEIRKNDRGFKRGDVLYLREWDQETGKYTGSECTRIVRFIMRGPGFGIENGYCVMSIE